MKELADAASNEKESLTAEVSEMFAGKTYVLFKYRIIRDVRLAYAPPQSIGNFGGETDNWVWPRHTGDFSIMRAYVSKDGKAETFSKENVPFNPKKFLKINPNGVDEGDFVFILGYPGRTYRHRPSQYLKYQQEYLLPYTAELYNYAIETLQQLGKGNKEFALATANRIKSLANTAKNFQGKLKGLKKLNLVSQKENEEKELQNFINADPELSVKYGGLLKKIDGVFANVNETAQAELWLRQIFNLSPTLSLANFVFTYAEQLQKPDTERLNQFQEKNLKQTLSNIKNTLSVYNKEYEEKILLKIFTDAKNFSKGSRILVIDQMLTGDNPNSDEVFSKFIHSTIIDSKILDEEYFNSLLNKTIQELSSNSDPLLNFVNQIRIQNKIVTEKNERNEGELNELYGDLVDVKILWKRTNFIPDANSTLRLTYGYIKGYSPADASYLKPFTTIDGIIEKNSTGSEDFAIPDKLRTLYDKKDFGRYASAKLNNLPVAILYNMDTTGGNSGSPILDAHGELIGVNFDRAYEATINDFAWNESYSRSIGVDIRYVLWVLDKFSGAENLLKEIGVN